MQSLRQPEIDPDLTTTRIKRFINSLRPSQTFFTRDVLQLGPRNSVDKCLSRMVQTNTITRLARGYFLPNKPNAKVPSLEEIAKGKAKAFKRSIEMHGINAIKIFFENCKTDCARTFATNGNSSSFQSVHGRIVLVGMAPRKLALGNTEHGLLIRALWHFRKPALATVMYAMLRPTLGRRLRNTLRQSADVMPAWLTNIIIWADSYMHELEPEDEDWLAPLTVKLRQTRV
jgi:hypothetical protein